MKRISKELKRGKTDAGEKEKKKNEYIDKRNKSVKTLKKNIYI